MTTKQDEFKEAWYWHINQLAGLALQARVEYPEYKEIKVKLETWVDEAVKFNNATQRKDHE